MVNGWLKPFRGTRDGAKSVYRNVAFSTMNFSLTRKATVRTRTVGGALRVLGLDSLQYESEDAPPLIRMPGLRVEGSVLQLHPELLPQSRMQ